MHVPLWHVSVCVHALVSLHAVPSGFAGLLHRPVAGLQVPTSWHWSLAVQTTGFDPVHVPLWHASVCVQALPSLHAVPFGAFGFEQVPVAESHAPATWHWPLAVHETGFAPVHVPDWHVSVCVQGLPSLHAVPFGADGVLFRKSVTSFAPWSTTTRSGRPPLKSEAAIAMGPIPVVSGDPAASTNLAPPIKVIGLAGRGA